MVEAWALTDDGAVLSAAAVADVLRDRIGDGALETWLMSSADRSLAVMSNGERAMVILFADEDDPGEHAVSPDATGSSGGYVLSNGQIDDYADVDTVPLGDALRIVAHIVATGGPPADTAWQEDR